MKYTEKQKLFDAILLEWGDKLKIIPSILDYLSDYPELFPRGCGINFIGLDEMHESQLEWVSLVAQLENPIETTFFRNYWVPVQIDEYDFFIDLSSDEFPLFEICYFFAEPYRWYKSYIFSNLNDLMVVIDDSEFDMKNYKNRIVEDRESQFNRFLEEHYELGFAGKLKFTPLDRSELFLENQQSQCKLLYNTLTITGVKPAILSLLPLDAGLSINKIHIFHNRYENAIVKIKTVKAFSHYIQSTGFRNVIYYKVIFNTIDNSYAVFKVNTIKIRHADTSILKAVMDKFEHYQKL